MDVILVVLSSFNHIRRIYFYFHCKFKYSRTCVLRPITYLEMVLQNNGKYIDLLLNVTITMSVKVDRHLNGQNGIHTHSVSFCVSKRPSTNIRSATCNKNVEVNSTYKRTLIALVRNFDYDVGEDATAQWSDRKTEVLLFSVER